nr:response regulator receiver protein [Streptomyces tsukubensis NRRL18488]
MRGLPDGVADSPKRQYHTGGRECRNAVHRPLRVRRDRETGRPGEPAPALPRGDVRLGTPPGARGTTRRSRPEAARADGGVLSAEYLLDKAWDATTDPLTNAVRLVVYTLRRKLGEPRLVHTAISAGYYLGTE